MGRLNVKFPQGKPGGFTAYCRRPRGRHIESVRLSRIHFSSATDAWISIALARRKLNSEPPDPCEKTVNARQSRLASQRVVADFPHPVANPFAKAPSDFLHGRIR